MMMMMMMMMMIRGACGGQFNRVLSNGGKGVIFSLDFNTGR